MMTMVDADADDSEINLVVILIPDRNWMWRTKGGRGGDECNRDRTSIVQAPGRLRRGLRLRQR